MNILDLVLNGILNWIIFLPDSMKKWIFKMYRTGLPQALSQATQRPSTLLSAPGCIGQNSLLPLASSIETSCDDDTACLFLWKNIFTRTFVCVRAKLTIVLVFLFFFYEPESLLWFESEKGDGDKQRWTNKWLVLKQSCKKILWPTFHQD